MKRVVIDTDVGIDDFAAVMLLLASKGVEVVGATVCFGNISLEHCRRTLSLLLPTSLIAEGSAVPLVKPRDTDACWPGHGPDGVGGALELLTAIIPAASLPPETASSSSSSPPPPHAASELVRLARLHGHLLHILAIGPLTNVALAVQMDPAAFEHCHVVCMGGALYGKGNTSFGAEFNFHADPHAARIVLRFFGSRILIVPWETTCDVPLPWEWRLRSPVMGPMLRVYQEELKAPHLILCDLVAAAVLVDESLITSKLSMACKVLVSDEDGEAGTVVWDWYGRKPLEPKVNVVQAVDAEALIRLCQDSGMLELGAK